MASNIGTRATEIGAAAIDKIDQRWAALEERIQRVQIAPGGVSLWAALKMALFAVCVGIILYIAGCRAGQAELRAEMDRSNKAGDILKDESKKVSASDSAIIRELRESNASLQQELAEIRAARAENLSEACSLCRVPGGRFPIGMRGTTDPAR